MNIAGEGTEILPVRTQFAGQSQCQIGATVKAVLKGDDGLASRRRASDLDGVLNRFGAAIHQKRLFGSAAGRDVTEPLRQLDIRLGCHHMGTCVGVARRLSRDGRHHIRVAVANVERTDSAGEVEVYIAINVGYLCTMRCLRINMVIRIDAAGKVPLAIGIKRLGSVPGVAGLVGLGLEK